MPSPFPGMDPYLEGPFWTSVHSQLIVEIARLLTPRLVPRYAALTERRFVMTLPEVEEGVAISTTSMWPDAAVIERGGAGNLPAGAVAAAPLELLTLCPEPVPQTSLEIRDIGSNRLVTAIELLSPWNKQGVGRDEYLAKRNRLLLSTAHLMEIDLLRVGERVPMRRPLPGAPYFVFLSRAGRRPRTEVWPVRLDEPLPKVAVPLLGGDADVPLDLQQALTNVYDSFGYPYLVDYNRPPQPALDAETVRWADERVRTWRAARG